MVTRINYLGFSQTHMTQEGFNSPNCAVVKNILLIPMKLTTKMNPKILGFNIYMTNFKQAKHPILLNSNSKPLLKKKKKHKNSNSKPHTHIQTNLQTQTSILTRIRI